MTKVLITGAAGALGRAVIAHMKSLGGYEIIAAIRRGDIDATASVRCDVGDQAQLCAVFDRVEPDLVIHLAATFDVDLGKAYSANVAPAQHILELVQRSGHKTRVLLIGSAAEYGAVRPKENPVREDRVLAPVSAYGVSKAWQTQLVGLYAFRGVDVVCARLFNLFGPGVSDRLFAGRVRKQIDEILAKRRSVIEVGPLTATRDYVSTGEAAAQLLSIATYGESGGIYHVASGLPITMREVLMGELSACGLGPSIVRESPSLSNRSGYDVPVMYADIGKTRQLIENGGRNA